MVLHVLDGALFATGLALAQPETLQPGFINDAVARVPHLGDYRNTIVGILGLIRLLTFMMPQQLWAAKLAEGRERIKGLLMIFALSERLPWLFIGLMTGLVAPKNPELAIYLFMALVFVGYFDLGLVYPVWQEMVAKTTPVRKRGLLFALREGAGGILGFVMIISLRPLVTQMAFPANYAFLFLGMFTLTMFSFVPLIFLKEAPYPVAREHVGMTEHFKRLIAMIRSDDGLLRYFACRAVHGLIQIAGQYFFVMRAVKVLGTETAAGLVLGMAAVVTISKTPISLLAGPLGDRFGYRVVMSLSSVLAGSGIFAALTAESAWGFYAASALATFAHMAFWLGNGNYILELAPPGKRPSYIGINSIMGLPFVIALPLGGLLADRFGYGPPFVAGIILSLAAAIMFLTVCVDPRERMKGDLVA
jgi:MFS family permease